MRSFSSRESDKCGGRLSSPARPGSRFLETLSLIALCIASFTRASAQEPPYFITYNHQMEEPGSLEISLQPVFGTQRGGGSFLASSIEFGYGAKGWWTSELYLDGQSTQRDSAVFTGFRWENRFRPLLLEHRINPVLYIEFEDINGADKTFLEVVGHDVESDHAEANRVSRRDHLHEVETKLILSSQIKAWEIAENFIAEKNLTNAPWEFGYAIGVSRPLALAARPGWCSVCPENFAVGAELYGGLGDQNSVGLSDTSHYLAALLSWNLPSGTTLRLSPTFGLNSKSHRFLLRCGASFEVSGFGRRIRRLSRGDAQ
jgi:hypothetical protein